jgi:hypothetical protein
MPAAVWAPAGTPVLMTDGKTGVLLSHRAEDDAHQVRLGGARGEGSETIYVARKQLARTVRAAVGFAVRTPLGRGLVLELQPEASRDVFLVQLGWRLSTGDAAVGCFDDASVECVGAAVLPVVERLCSQANLFLFWSATHMSTLVDTLGGGGDEEAGDQLSFLDKIQAGLESSGEVLLAKLGRGAQSDVSGQGEGGGPVDDHGVAARGEAVLRHQLNETRSVAKKMLTELEDAGRTESRVRGLLGEARRRLKELAVTVPVADLQRNATHALDGAMAASLAGGGGIGVDDITAGIKSVEKLAADKEAMAKLVAEGQARLRESAALEQVSKSLADSDAAKELEAVKATIAQVLSPTVRATAQVVAGEGGAIAGKRSDREGSSSLTASGSSTGDNFVASIAGEKDEVAEVTEAARRASEAAATKLAAAQKEVEGHLEASKEQIDCKMKELSTEVSEAMSALVDLAKQDEKVADILEQLEGQSTTIESMQTRFAASKAALEAQRGKEMVLGRVGKLLQAREVDMVKATGIRIAARVMEDDSAARKKSDQLVRSVTSRIQSRLLGVNAGPEGVGVGGTGADGLRGGVSSLYDLLNIDALLVTVEKDLVNFLMDQHKRLTDGNGDKWSGDLAVSGRGSSEMERVGGGGVVSQVSSLLDDDECWDPRVQFMVSFIKDCTKVSIKDQLSKGLEGLRERLRDPASLKVPLEAVVRLEEALFDLLDLGSGGLVELHDLGTFWEFIERGDSLAAAGEQALALLPELESTAGQLVDEIDSQVLGVSDVGGGAASEGGSRTGVAAARTAVTGTATTMAKKKKKKKKRLRSGLAGAVAKLGGDIPEPIRQLLAAQGGLKGLGNGAAAGLGATGGAPLSVSGAIDTGVGLLNSEKLVGQVQELVAGAGGALTSIEALQSDARVQAALETLASREMEEKLMSGIEGVDVDALVDDAELALTDLAARQRLVDGMKDACLEFLLQYLPSMPIPPIDGEQDGLEYSISNLDLSRFKLRKEDVSVTLGDLSELNRSVEKERRDKEAEAVSAAQPPPITPPHGGAASPLVNPPKPPSMGGKKQGKPDSTLLTIKARNISAEFVQLHWSYKQKFFPYLEGGGSCDAVVQDASITLSFEIRRDFRRKKTDQAKSGLAHDASTVSPAADAGAVVGGASAVGSTSSSCSASPDASEKGKQAGTRENMATGTEGSGVFAALLEVAGASNSIVTMANSMGSPQGQQPQTSLIWEPVLILGNCDIQIADLELKMAATGSLAWVYNLMAGLFREQIREYVIGSLGDTIAENAEALLGTINAFVRNSWPVIAAATNANLDKIPLLDRDVATGQSLELRKRTAGGRQIRIKLEQPGALGLHLDINTKRGIIRFSGPVPGGQVRFSLYSFVFPIALAL